MEKKHIQNITENDDSVTITFGKSDGDNKERDRQVSDSKPSMVSAKSEEQKDNKEQEKNKDNNEMEEKQKAEDLSFENKSNKIATQESTKEKLFRLFGFNNKKVDEEKRTVGLAFSSEEPYDRSFGTEILSHNPSDIDFSFIASGRAPLLLNHDFEKQIGVIEKAEISEADKVGRAVVRFGKSKLADEVFRDVIDGIRSNVSVGYEIMKMEKIKNDDEDKEKPSYRVNWKPLEASIVSIPADTTVGVGRNRYDNLTDQDNRKEVIEVITRENTMEKAKETPKVEQSPVNVEEQIAKARKEETARIKEITALGAKHNCSDLAGKAVNDGVSLAQFRGIVLDKLGDAKPLDKKDEVGLSNKEERDYSIVKAIKAMTTGNWSGAELEKEASDEISRKTGKSPRGIFIPSDIRWQRDLISGASADGGALVATNLLAGSFIEDGWSIKRALKRIMLSKTYQQDSAAGGMEEDSDPQNIFLHRGNLRRLQGEAIRDSILAISGRLDRKMFGGSVPVHLTEFMTGRGRPRGGPIDGQGRRSIYISIKRNFISPMMLTFDTPIPFSTMGRRTVSNVPEQALIMMNDPFVHEQAGLWAKRIAALKLGNEEAVGRMYLEAFARPPLPVELSAGVEFLGKDANVEKLSEYAHVLFNTKEFIFLH